MAEYTGKTVYFLGAGASRASEFNFPCMEGFFRQNDLKSENYRNLLKFIEGRFSGIPFSELNLEEVITFLELSLDTFSSFGEHPESYIYEARREFDKYVNWRLSIPDCKGCQQHKKIIDVNLAGKNSKDSIITLNYDLIVDYTLYELSPKKNQKGSLSYGCLLSRMYDLLREVSLLPGTQPTLYHPHKELGFYLKLHGSIDWIYCPNTTCLNHQYFFPIWLGSDKVHHEPGDLCNLCGSPLISIIVPPTMYKTFEKFPKLGLFWSLAYRELNKSDRIVIFGVSFAPSDYYLRWLFKKAVTERQTKPIIFDIDISDCVSDEIEKITGIKPIYKKTLDEFLKEKDREPSI